MSLLLIFSLSHTHTHSLSLSLSLSLAHAYFDMHHEAERASQSVSRLAAGTMHSSKTAKHGLLSKKYPAYMCVAPKSP